MYDSIIKGLSEAVEYEKGKSSAAKSYKVSISAVPCFGGEEIRDLRLKQQLTQQSLAAILGVSQKTVEAWEAGRNIPQGPAQRLIGMMVKDDSLLEKYAILTR